MTSCGGHGWCAVATHLSRFTIQGTRYSNPAPQPDDPNAAAIRANYWMEDDEERVDVPVGDVMLVGSVGRYEYDYGDTMELFLENLGRHGDLVGLPRRRPPWHGDRTAVLARNKPDAEWVAGEDPARWRRLTPTTRRVNAYPSATNADRRPGAASW